MLDNSEGYVTEDGRKIGGVVMEMKNMAQLLAEEGS